MLECLKIPAWPKLAWVARRRQDADRWQVLHGPLVETRDHWVAEAVWAGPFEQGDFDRTDLVFGSGVRQRDGQVTFVPAGSVFDRLWFARFSGGTDYVANSLPALLASSGASLRDDYPRYSSDIRTIIRGLDDCVRSVPTSAGPVSLQYFHNLCFADGVFRTVAKPDAAEDFPSYEAYRAFLAETAEALAANAADPGRQAPVTPLTTVSSGYDSVAAAVVSRDAGCHRAVTIAQSSSLWRGSDSGAHVAETLGMTCRAYPRAAEAYPHEAAFWAGEGRPGVINWTQFDYPPPLSVLFTGSHGEKMWDRVSHDHPDPFVRRGTTSLGLCEFRLHVGAFQCPVPFWGARHSESLHRITERDMQPWYFGPDHYDKPIARRIAEEAGISRETFGVCDKNTSMESRFVWPYGPEAQADFVRYLRAHGLRGFGPGQVARMRARSKVDNLLYHNVYKRLKLPRPSRAWDRIRLESWPFRWAVDTLRDRQAQALRSAGVAMHP